MLTSAEEDRIEEALPDTVTVEHDGITQTYDLEVFWQGGSTTENYPMVVFQWDTQNEPRPERQPTNGLKSIENPTDEEGLTETHTNEVSDDLSITIAVEATAIHSGIAPQTRGSQISRQIWRLFEKELDLNHVGPNGERPMRIETQSAITPGRVENTLRFEWTVRFHHSELHEVGQETAADAEFTAEQTDN